MKESNNQLLVVTHLSQLLDIVTGFGGLLIPLIIWASFKDKIYQMDMHGKAIINFRISMFLYLLISIPLVLVFGLGILGILAVSLAYLVLPIINAIKASRGDEPNYPLSVKFI